MKASHLGALGDGLQIVRQLLCVLVEDKLFLIVMHQLREGVPCLFHLIGRQEVRKVEADPV